MVESNKSELIEGVLAEPEPAHEREQKIRESNMMLHDSPEFHEWLKFLGRWHAEYGSETVHVAQLRETALGRFTSEPLLVGLMGSKSKRSQQIRLGQAMVRMAGRVCAGYSIIKCYNANNGKSAYKIRDLLPPSNY